MTKKELLKKLKKLKHVDDNAIVYFESGEGTYIARNIIVAPSNNGKQKQVILYGY